MATQSQKNGTKKSSAYEVDVEQEIDVEIDAPQGSLSPPPGPKNPNYKNGGPKNGNNNNKEPDDEKKKPNNNNNNNNNQKNDNADIDKVVQMLKELKRSINRGCISLVSI